MDIQKVLIPLWILLFLSLCCLTAKLFYFTSKLLYFYAAVTFWSSNALLISDSPSVLFTVLLCFVMRQ